MTKSTVDLYDYAISISYPESTADQDSVLLDHYMQAKEDAESWLHDRMEEELDEKGLKSTRVLLHLPLGDSEVKAKATKGSGSADILHTPIGDMSAFMYTRIVAEKDNPVRSFYQALSEIADGYSYVLLFGTDWAHDTLNLGRYYYQLMGIAAAFQNGMSAKLEPLRDAENKAYEEQFSFDNSFSDDSNAPSWLDDFK